MIVAFMDLLGFSNLLRNNMEVAIDNLNTFNSVIKTRVIDNKCHPIEEYRENYPNDVKFQQFVEKSSVTSFEQMISFSDSLVLGGTDCNMFIKQLMNFVATVYIEYSEPFQKNFSDINQVTTYKVAEGCGSGSIQYHKAFPILFRGGLSVGNDVTFWDEYCINDSDFKISSRNVMGLTYLNAVKLESVGKGPRLFCDKSLVDAVDDEINKYIKLVDSEKEIYEIVWTIEGCEATGCCSSNKWSNVINRINDKMLPAAINLYKYYQKDKGLDSFEDTNRVYKSQELFPAFSSRLPDRKRKDINKILKRYGLEQYDSYELLKRGGAKLPIDNLQFIDLILNFSQEFKKSFYLAGVRHYLGCNGDNCCEAVKIVPGEEIKFVWEADNLYDKNAVQVYDQREKLIGYVPRYYAEAFAAFIKEKRVKKGKILCVDKNRNCDECIKIEVSVAGV